MVNELLGTGTPHQGVMGNGSMTVCLRPDGNLRCLYWPHLGYAEHMKDAAAGIFVGSPEGGKFRWLDGDQWEVSQKYLRQTNIIETKYHGHGLSVSRASFIDPQLDVFVTLFRVSTEAETKSARVLLFQNPELDETRWGDATFYDPMRDVIVQYRRNTYFAFGAAERSESHQCGIGGMGGDARADCEDGRLENTDAALHRGRKGVNSALAYDLGEVAPNHSKSLCYIAAAGEDKERAISLLETTRSIGARPLIARAVDHWKSLLRQGRRRSKVPYHSLVERSLLTLLQLCDRKSGGIIASPSTDPDYRYVWPRDAFYVALALDRSGFHAQPERFYRWCTAAQDRTGALHQRYFSTPELIGPSWGPAWGEEIDETACVLWGMVEHLKLTGDRGFLSEVWPFIREAAWYLVSSRDHTGRVKPSMNLWEEEPTCHVYSEATVAAALNAASKAADELGYSREAQRWDRDSKAVRKHLLDTFWDERLGHFLRSAEPRDEQVDISSLAISYPFGIIPDRDPRMVKNARAISDAFKFPAGGVGRFSSDTNYGGNPWIISTCWLSIHHSMVGDAATGRALLSWAASHATGLGMLSEQVDKNDGTVRSAVPLAWSHAMFVLASQALARRR